jgi:hypothetical protein
MPAPGLLSSANYSEFRTTAKVCAGIGSEGQRHRRRTNGRLRIAEVAYNSAPFSVECSTANAEVQHRASHFPSKGVEFFIRSHVRDIGETVRQAKECGNGSDIPRVLLVEPVRLKGLDVFVSNLVGFR